MKIKIEGDVSPSVISEAITKVLETIPIYQKNPDNFLMAKASIYFNFYSPDDPRKLITFADSEGVPHDEFTYNVASGELELTVKKKLVFNT